MQRIEYTLNEFELGRLLEASKPVPAMFLSDGKPMFSDPAESAESIWRQIGDELGFVWDSARPVAGKGEHVFSAIPKEVK